MLAFKLEIYSDRILVLVTQDVAGMIYLLLENGESLVATPVVNVTKLCC
jgi:hypothetical protein